MLLICCCTMRGPIIGLIWNFQTEGTVFNFHWELRRTISDLVAVVVTMVSVKFNTWTFTHFVTTRLSEFIDPFISEGSFDEHKKRVDLFRLSPLYRVICWEQRDPKWLFDIMLLDLLLTSKIYTSANIGRDLWRPWLQKQCCWSQGGVVVAIHCWCNIEAGVILEEKDCA